VISGTSAGFGRRFAALLYDGLLIAAVLTVYTLLAVLAHGGALTRDSAGPWWYLYRAGEVMIIGAYYVFNWMRSGQTLGMRAWRLKAVSDSGKPLTFAPAVLRFVLGAAAWTPAALGVLWLYLDSEHLAMHDRLSRTRMVLLSRA
jgi:uncharacterized RDD family membrane protein YckC